METMETTDRNMLYIPLEGVENEHCAMIVDNGLKELEGVTTHKVELNNNRAIINETKAFNIPPDALKANRDPGYGLTTGKKNFPVLDLALPSCANNAQTLPRRPKGVVGI